jgi:hypothetical protein
MFSLTSASSCSNDHHLLIADTLRSLQTVNPDIAEVAGENLTAFGQPFIGDDEHQNPSWFQPAIRVAQECLLSATTVSRPKGPIVRRIQIQEAKALDRALHLQRISLNGVGNPLPGLFGTVGVKLNTVTKHVGTAGDHLEGHAIANTRVDRGRGSIWELEETAKPLGLDQCQWVEAKPTFAEEAQSGPPFF